MDSKRGQVTLFIIVGIIIVAVAVLIYLFYPKLTSSSLSTDNPNSFIQGCLEDAVIQDIEILSMQGGYLDPEKYYLYENEKIGYLCYTNEYYSSCVVQKPILEKDLADQIRDDLSEEITACFSNLQEEYKNQNYEVNFKTGEANFELLPKRVVGSFNYTMSLRKGDTSQVYDTFRVVVNNNLYELLSIAKSIISWETQYGDSDVTLYMDVYHDLKIEKQKQSDETTIYIIEDRNTQNKFQFASRSFAWPPGIASKNLG